MNKSDECISSRLIDSSRFLVPWGLNYHMKYSSENTNNLLGDSFKDLLKCLSKKKKIMDELKKVFLSSNFKQSENCDLQNYICF